MSSYSEQRNQVTPYLCYSHNAGKINKWKGVDDDDDDNKCREIRKIYM
jgi:hypothetical protein